MNTYRVYFKYYFVHVIHSLYIENYNRKGNWLDKKILFSPHDRRTRACVTRRINRPGCAYVTVIMMKNYALSERMCGVRCNIFSTYATYDGYIVKIAVKYDRRNG